MKSLLAGDQLHVVIKYGIGITKYYMQDVYLVMEQTMVVQGARNAVLVDAMSDLLAEAL